MSKQATHTPGPWTVPPENGCYVATENGNQICGLDNRQNRRNDARLIAAAPLLEQAIRAHHAWAYCEHHSLGTFDTRQILCAHAEYLTAKSIATIDGRDFDQEYEGRKRLIIWPQARLDESNEAEAEAIIQEAFEHERAAIDKATGE